MARGPARVLAAAGLLGLLVCAAAAAPVDENAVRAIGAKSISGIVVCQIS